MNLGERLQALVLNGKLKKQFEPSKNSVRREHYTATAEVEEEHTNKYGVKRKVVVKRGRFLIGQYLDRSKYRGDGSLVTSPTNGDGGKK